MQQEVVKEIGFHSFRLLSFVCFFFGNKKKVFGIKRFPMNGSFKEVVWSDGFNTFFCRLSRVLSLLLVKLNVSSMRCSVYTGKTIAALEDTLRILGKLFQQWYM